MAPSSSTNHVPLPLRSSAAPILDLLNKDKVSNMQLKARNTALARFQQTFHRGPAAVFLGLEMLRDKQSLHTLTSADCFRIAECINGLDNDALLDSAKAFDDQILIVLARSLERTQPLAVLMQRLIRAGQYSAVIGLFNRFMALTPPRRATMTPNEEEEIELGIISSFGKQGQIYTKAHITLCAVVAHTHNTDLPSAFRATVDAGLAMENASDVDGFLEPLLRHDPQLHRRTRDNLYDIILAGCVFEPRFLYARLKSQSLPDTARAYQTIFGSYPSLQGWEQLEQRVSRPEGSPSIVECLQHVAGVFIEKFSSHRSADDAGRVWMDLIRMGFTPSWNLCHKLLENAVRSKNYDRALAICQDMERYEAEPTVIGTSLHMSALFGLRRRPEAEELFAALRKQWVQVDEAGKKVGTAEELAQLTRTFNMVISGLLGCRGFEEAQKLFEEMQTSGPPVDTTTFNSFITYHVKQKDMGSIAQVLRSLSQHGVRPDEFTFTAILQGLQQAGRPDAHERCWKLMDTMGFQPNVVLFSSMIDHQVREPGGYVGAMQTLARMEADPRPECRPNEVTYTSLLSGVYRDPTVDQGLAHELTAELLRRMAERGIIPNRVMRNFLITSAMQGAGAHGELLAMFHFREMKKEGKRMQGSTYYILLRGLLQRKRVDLAREVVQEMDSSGHVPQGALLELVHNVRKGISPFD